ncbi:MAG: FAD-binding oxidoreductase [Myxococcota bacterium]
MTASALDSTAPASLVDDLAEIVGRAYVLTDVPDRLAYNADCWPRGIIRTRGRRLEGNLPLAIVQPRNEHEVAGLIAWARETGTALVPYGAGSGVCGGAVAEQDQVIVDVKRMREIIETRPDDMTVRVEAGMVGWPFEKELQRRGFTLGHFPSSIYCSSVGGWVAARGAGQYSSLYGKIEDMTASMRVVAGTGEAFETAPDFADERPRRLSDDFGPDLTQIFVGSEGTLGVITEATFFMSKLPDHQFYRGFQLPSVEVAIEALRDLMQSGLRPAVVRLYDSVDTFLHKSGDSDGEAAPGGMVEKLQALAEERLPSVTSAIRSRIRDVSNNLFGRVLGQPMAINSLANVLPSTCLLVLGFEGHGPLAEDEAEYGFDLLNRYGLDLGPEPGHHWIKNRFSVSYKQSPTFDTGAFVDTMEVSTTWDNVIPLYNAVRQALAPHVVVLAHFSHVYPEGSSIYFTFAGFAEDTEKTLALYDRTWKAGLDAVAGVGASVAHHHGVGKSKAPWSHHDHTGGPALFRALKSSFDPDNIMNPGKVYPQHGGRP